MFIYRTIYSLGYCWVRVELICVKCLISAWLPWCLLREKEGEESSKESEGELAPVTQINMKSSLFSLNHLMGASPCLQFSWTRCGPCWAMGTLTVLPGMLFPQSTHPLFQLATSLLSSELRSAQMLVLPGRSFFFVFLTSQLGLEFFYKETCLQP